MSDLKKSMIYILVGCGLVLFASVSFGSTLTIENNGWRYGQNISTGTYDTNVPSQASWVGEIRVTASDISVVEDDSYWTFCLELDETLDWGHTYHASVNTEAVNGGVGSSNPDPLSPNTAWLYHEYLNGFSNYDQDYSVDNNNEGRLLQEAIWALEEEIDPSYVTGNKYYSLVNSNSNWSDIGHIRVINLTDSNGNLKQDVLVSGAPIPGAAWLLGAGILGLIGCRRKKTI